MTLLEVLVGVALIVGVIGVVVPILPGALLSAAALVVWAVATGGATAWGLTILALVVLGIGQVVKYTVPRRRLREAGIPASTQWAGVALAVVGFFAVPVVGLFLGFPLGVYLAEHQRVGSREAWPSTRRALAAVGLSMLIEAASTVVAALVWVVGVVIT